MKSFKQFLSEAYNIAIHDISSVPTVVKQNQDLDKLRSLFAYLQGIISTEIPLVADDKTGSLKVRRIYGQNREEIKTWISKNGTGLKIHKDIFGDGSVKDKSSVPKPSGADWEDIITHQYNKASGNENSDPSALDSAQKYYQ